MIPNDSLIKIIIFDKNIDSLFIIFVIIAFITEMLKIFISVDKKNRRKHIITFVLSLVIYEIVSKIPELLFFLIVGTIVFVLVKTICNIKINSYQNIIYIISYMFIFLLFEAIKHANLNDIINSSYYKELIIISFASLKMTFYFFATFTIIPIIFINLLCIIVNMIEILTQLIKTGLKYIKIKYIEKLVNNANDYLMRFNEKFLAEKTFNMINDKLSKLIKTTLIIVLIITCTIVEDPVYNFSEETKTCSKLIIFSSLMPLITSSLMQKKNQ